MAMYLAYYRNQFSLPDDVEHVSMANWTTYTYSRGHVHITGSGLTDPVDFDTGWLKDPGDVDVKKHISAYKVQREVWRRVTIFWAELAATHGGHHRENRRTHLERRQGAH
ncbi:hypothetical protein LTR37_004554 [Vermiconidia calcicola]|uniref:Uncharacterized protein n=1 Tax=Vermiconidia calcicola TaxID=1690605 RepID=A0ACC3NNF9_9PEZI|nr:hypothetical protein LTR37_004554 [Vermiconidia calcicola]